MTEFRFLGSIPIPLGLLLVLGLAALAWWIYRREVYDFPRPYRWLLPTLRSLAIALALLMLLEPTLRTRYYEGTPSRLQVWLDGTQSMQETDAGVSKGETPITRYDRAVQAIAGGDSPRLEKWIEHGDVTVSRFGGDSSTLLWQSTLTQPSEVPKQQAAWSPARWLSPTSIGTVLLRERLRHSGDPLVQSIEGQADKKSVDASENKNSSSDELLPVLLFTDGRDNSGPSPLEVLQAWPKENAPLYIVGVGSSQLPPRVAISSVESPQQLFRSDRLQGKLHVKEGVPAGENYRVAIFQEELEVWSQDLVSEGKSTERLVPFNIAIEEVVKALEAKLPKGQDAQRLTIPLTAKVITSQANAASNVALPQDQAKSWLISVTTRKQRVLLLDSRSRWETRYLRNALERDPQWEVDSFLLSAGEPPRWFSQGDEAEPFPSDEDSFANYDLIITGEIEPGSIPNEQIDYLQQAIERGGCGWVMIDGRRKFWRDPTYDSLQKMLPVEWIPGASVVDDTQWQAEPQLDAEASGVLQLSDGSSQDNLEAWQKLPKITSLSLVKALPGSQTLASLKSNQRSEPFIVTRFYGAGRVVYLSSDETWRWRYEVADKIHQRFWNQLCRWTMRLPFAVESEYIALDSGDPNYSAGQIVPVRARLRNSTGLPAEYSSVEAIASIDGKPIASTFLSADDALPGSYRGQFESLPPGDYSIHVVAPGFTEQEMSVRTSLRINETPNQELADVVRNDELLRQLADRTGGMYVVEDEMQKLWDRMDLSQRSKLIESDRLLWQSYWWFVPILILVALEWWFRKKGGLI
jgi:hypothetical protein